MSHFQTDQLSSYLCWLKERGEIWLNQIKVPSAHSPQPRSQQASLVDSPLNIFRGAGSASPSLIAIVDCIKGQDIVFGPERTLLLNILKAMNIEIPKDFLLLGLNTDRCSRPIGKREQALLELDKQVSNSPNFVTLVFGRLAYNHLFSRNIQDYEDHLGRVQSVSIDQANRKIIPLWHLQELCQDSHLKLRTWNTLKPFVSK